MSKFAWVTLSTNDTYSLGALVLAYSLKKVNTAHELAILVTPAVSEAMRQRLKAVYQSVLEVNVMDSQDTANLKLLARPELGITFTKLHCWRLLQYEKCVFLDADVLVLQNCDELFERDELSAAPDVSWPDCFNSGVFVYRPSQQTFDQILQFALQYGSFDGGDQGVLNQYFADWAVSGSGRRLPFIYNVTAYAAYCYLPAFKQYRDKIKILHFAGKQKPWLMPYNMQSRTVQIPSEYTHAADLLQLWWNIFVDKVHGHLNDNMRYYCPITSACDIVQQQENTIYDYGIKCNENSKIFIKQKHSMVNLQADQTDEVRTVQHYDPWDDYYKKQEILENVQTQQQQECIQYENEAKVDAENMITTGANIETTTKTVTITPKEKEEEKQVEVDEGLQYLSQVDLSEKNFYQVQQHKQYELNNVNNVTTATTTTTTINKDDLQCSFSFNVNQLENNFCHIQQREEEEEIQESLKTDNKDSCQLSGFGKEGNTNKMTILQTPTTTVTTVNENIQSQEYNTISMENVVSFCNVLKRTEDDDDDDGDDEDLKELYRKDKIKSDVDDEDNCREAGLAGVLSQLHLGGTTAAEQEAYELLMRRQSWEAGHIDYTGVDAFENIWKRIEETLQAKPDKSPLDS